MPVLSPSRSQSPTSNRNDRAMPPTDVAWAAIEKIAAKQKLAEQPKSGAAEGISSSIQLVLSGAIDGQPFRQSFDSVITIGHGLSKTSSVTPAVPELLAHVLSRLNERTRERILADVVDDFVANGNALPVSDEGLVARCNELLAELRSTRTVIARGPVRVQYTTR